MDNKSKFDVQELKNKATKLITYVKEHPKIVIGIVVVLIVSYLILSYVNKDKPENTPNADISLETTVINTTSSVRNSNTVGLIFKKNLLYNTAGTYKVISVEKDTDYVFNIPSPGDLQGKFLGWSINKNASLASNKDSYASGYTIYKNGNIFRPTKSTIFYAVWENNF